MPLYEHDCTACVYLGDYNDMDLYFCRQDVGGPTVVARHSSDGPDYSSGLAFAGRHPGLGEAKRRAVERGLLAE